MTVASMWGSRLPRVLVVTCSHRGDDARIFERQIGALVRAGADVVYVAPEPCVDATGVERAVIRRAAGRRRVRSWLDVHREVRKRAGGVGVILVHDLEAVIPVRLARPGVPIIWDVHEDLPASVIDRDWIPRLLRRPARMVTRAVEWIARRGIGLVLAEESYVERLGAWPVVPNSTLVPAELVGYRQDDRPRIVYVGRVSRARGVDMIIEVARRIAPDFEVVVVGPADRAVRPQLLAAAALGRLRWTGPLPNDAALQLVDGALVGLSPLEEHPNYVASMPTKVYEYAAHGVPAVVSPLPLAVRAVHESGAGAVVAYGDVDAMERVVRAYAADPDRRVAEGVAAHRWMREHHDWANDGERFVEHVTSVALKGPRSDVGDRPTILR